MAKVRPRNRYWWLFGISLLMVPIWLYFVTYPVYVSCRAQGGTIVHCLVKTWY